MAATSVVFNEPEIAGRGTPEFSFLTAGITLYTEQRLESGSIVMFSGIAWAGQQGNLTLVGSYTAIPPFLFRRKGETRWTPLPPDTWIRAEWVANLKFNQAAQEFVAPWDFLHILKETDLARVQVFE